MVSHTIVSYYRLIQGCLTTLILRLPNEIFLHFSVTFFPNVVAITTIAVGVSVAVFFILFSVLIAFIIYWKRFATITSDKNMFIKYPCI